MVLFVPARIHDYAVAVSAIIDHLAHKTMPIITALNWAGEEVEGKRTTPQSVSRGVT